MLHKKIGLLVILISVGIAANFGVRKTGLGDFVLFRIENLTAYLGLLLGFALTIYTFGLSITNNINSIIVNNKKFEGSKDRIREKLEKSFCEMRDDIWMILYSLLIIVFLEILRVIFDDFFLYSTEYAFQETVNIMLFALSTIAMWDIVKTLFNLGKIKLMLEGI